MALHPRPRPLTLWAPILAVGLPTGLALWLYGITAAPGLTWAHFGADGGDFLAAAAVNGVPHPPGYPLYLLILRGWLALGSGWDGLGLMPGTDPAAWGNRLNVVTGAAAIALTVLSAARLTLHPPRGLWAAAAGIIFLAAPLPWSQSLITEVYALHLFLAALLGYAALAGFAPWGLGLILGLTAAHHPTALLLWPAALWLWRQARPQPISLTTWLTIAGLALIVPGLAYAGLVWSVAGADTPPPVAWGYPDNAAGLLWLISGAAYRDYWLALSGREFIGRLAGAVQLLTEQFTPIGLAAVLTGLVRWEARPHLRVATLLWVIPVSLYAAAYATVDSFIYLLPAVWWLALPLAEGLTGWAGWLAARRRYLDHLLIYGLAAGMFVLITLRLPQVDLRADHAATDFLAAATMLPPGALVVSAADAETFALWYGVWGGGGLADRDLVLINSELYQFGWYRRLMQDVYPDVQAIGAAWTTLLAANQPVRPIVYVEPPPAQDGMFAPLGRFWQRISD